MVKYYRAGQVTADNMAHARCMLITKASGTHSEYVVLTAVSLQKWLHKRASILRNIYTARASWTCFSR